MTRETDSCAACGAGTSGEYGIHRDELALRNDGAEVPLCEDCGGPDGPDLPEIWQMIRERGIAGVIDG
jgi:NAD-dependent SIR2 family protein deacetylase